VCTFLFSARASARAMRVRTRAALTKLTACHIDCREFCFADHAGVVLCDEAQKSSLVSDFLA